MKPSTVASKTMAIKARVYNQIRKDLFKAPTSRIASYKDGKTTYSVACDMTELQKLAFFNKWFELNRQAHNELNAYKRKRKEQAKVEKIREEKGYYRKKLAKIEQRREFKKHTKPAVDLNTYNNYVDGLNDIKVAK